MLGYDEADLITDVLESLLLIYSFLPNIFLIPSDSIPCLQSSNYYPF